MSMCIYGMRVRGGVEVCMGLGLRQGRGRVRRRALPCTHGRPEGCVVHLLSTSG